ncbi:MAG TPA: hypothetical protein VJ836_00820 [Candidatus Saccharimonadales bacterium]|nr:hypothetical protein [Candidatus Saccharimonadales bacterium]
MNLERVKKLLSSYWLYVVVSLFLIFGLFGWYIEQRPNLDNSGYTTEVSISRPIEAKPLYPSPAKEVGSLYKTYTIGDIQFNVSVLETNVSRKRMHGGHLYRIDYYNSTNHPITLSKEQTNALDIGCIASLSDSYKTIKEDQSIIDRSMNNYKPRTSAYLSTLDPFVWKRITIEIDTDCIYIGTVDLKYYWSI